MKSLKQVMKQNLIIVLSIIITSSNLLGQVTEAKKDNPKNYLTETQFCDFNNPVFDEVVFDKSISKSELAVDIFHFVRDKLELGVDSLDVKASDVLTRDTGACWNKALLMTALLRKYEIPSKIIKVPLNHNFLEPMAGENIKYLNNPFYHCFVQVYLDDTWIYANPSIDLNNFEQYYLPLNLSWNMEWDGKSDHIIHTDKFMGPFEIIENIDEAYSTTIGNMKFK